MSIGGSTVGASINLELDLGATANSAIGQTNFRDLAEVPTGQISLSDFYGKSNILPVTSRIQFWGIPTPLPRTNGATRVSYTSGAIDLNEKNELISFGDRGTTTCIVTEECGGSSVAWNFVSSSLSVLKFTPEGALFSAKDYTWSSAQALPGFYGDSNPAARRLMGLKDSSGNYYIKTSTNYGVNVRQGIIKLNPDLSVAWAKSFLSNFTFGQNFYAQNVTKNGDIYCWAHSNAGNSIIKVNSNGVFQWAYQYGYSLFWGLGGVGGDSLGNCYALAQLGTSSYRLDKFDSTGTWVKGWNWPISAISGAAQTTFAEDNEGNILVFTCSATSVLQILKFDADFNLIWQRTLTNPIIIQITAWSSIRFDDNNNCILLTNGYLGDTRMLASYSPDGTLLWSRIFNEDSQAFDLAFSQDFTNLGIIGQPADRSDLSPYPEGFSTIGASQNVAVMVLPVPVAPLTSNPLSNGTVNATISITTGGTSSTPTRILTPLTAPSRSALLVTLDNIAISVTNTFYVAKISEQIL